MDAVQQGDDGDGDQPEPGILALVKQNRARLAAENEIELDIALDDEGRASRNNQRLVTKESASAGDDAEDFSGRGNESASSKKASSSSGGTILVPPSVGLQEQESSDVKSPNTGTRARARARVQQECSEVKNASNGNSASALEPAREIQEPKSSFQEPEPSAHFADLTACDKSPSLQSDSGELDGDEALRSNQDCFSFCQSEKSQRVSFRSDSKPYESTESASSSKWPSAGRSASTSTGGIIGDPEEFVSRLGGIIAERLKDELKETFLEAGTCFLSQMRAEMAKLCSRDYGGSFESLQASRDIDNRKAVVVCSEDALPDNGRTSLHFEGVQRKRSAAEDQLPGRPRPRAQAGKEHVNGSARNPSRGGIGRRGSKGSRSDGSCPTDDEASAVQIQGQQSGNAFRSFLDLSVQPQQAPVSHPSFSGIEEQSALISGTDQSSTRGSGYSRSATNSSNSLERYKGHRPTQETDCHDQSSAHGSGDPRSATRANNGMAIHFRDCESLHPSNYNGMEMMRQALREAKNDELRIEALRVPQQELQQNELDDGKHQQGDHERRKSGESLSAWKEWMDGRKASKGKSQPPPSKFGNATSRPLSSASTPRKASKGKSQPPPSKFGNATSHPLSSASTPALRGPPSSSSTPVIPQTWGRHSDGSASQGGNHGGTKHRRQHKRSGRENAQREDPGRGWVARGSRWRGNVAPRQMDQLEQNLDESLFAKTGLTPSLNEKAKTETARLDKAKFDHPATVSQVRKGQSSNLGSPLSSTRSATKASPLPPGTAVSPLQNWMGLWVEQPADSGPQCPQVCDRYNGAELQSGMLNPAAAEESESTPRYTDPEGLNSSSKVPSEEVSPPSEEVMPDKVRNRFCTRMEYRSFTEIQAERDHEALGTDLEWMKSELRYGSDRSEVDYSAIVLTRKGWRRLIWLIPRFIGFLPVCATHYAISNIYRMFLLCLLGFNAAVSCSRVYYRLLDGLCTSPTYLTDAVVALGCFIVLLAMLWHRKYVLHCEGLVKSYSHRMGFLPQLEESIGKKHLLVLAVSIGMAPIIGFVDAGTCRREQVELISHSVAVFSQFGICLYLQQAASYLSVVVDCFSCHVVREPEYMVAVSEWNLIQAQCRSVSRAISVAFVVSATVGMSVALTVLADGLQDNYKLAHAMPNLIIALLLLHSCMGIAQVTDKCSKVSTIVNSIDETLIHGKLDLVEHVHHSRAGIYIYGVQVDCAALFKMIYVGCAAAFTIATKAG